MDPENNLNKKVVAKPWYKYPMVWFVVALPMTAVIASIATLIIAANNPPQVIEHNASYQSKQVESKEQK